MANLAKDVKLINGDIYINPLTNDFDIEFSDAQHVEDIINSSPGSWKEFPLLGVGARAYLAGSNILELQKEVRVQLESDGYRVSKVALKSLPNGTNTFDIEAERI